MKIKKKRMSRQRNYKIIAAFLSLFLGISGLPAFASAEPQAKAYVLMEASSGKVLKAQNPEERLPMASTTKILTCILALEYGDMDDLVKVDDCAVGQEGSSIYLQKGETILLHDLVYGLMLASGNDAAVAIACHISGSVQEFAKLMNQKAKEIGAKNSNFVTPNGLPNDDHYTTAYDLALISSYGMQNPLFREIVGTTSLNLPADEDSPARYLRSKNKILYQLEGGNGIKTGYTKKAGKCLSAGACRNGMQLVAVVLNDPDMFQDCKDLLEYGFFHYSMHSLTVAGDVAGNISVENGIQDQMDVIISKEIALPFSEEEYKMISRKIKMQKSVQAPVEAGEQVGMIEFWLQDEKIAESPLVAAESVQKDTFSYHLKRILANWMHLERWKEIENRQIFSAGGGRIS